MEEKSALRRFTDKLYGGIDLTWLKVILFAVGTAVITAVFLIVPIFKDTSFMRIGETLEAWVLFAVIIIANCKKPLESALKTFVFFLISQPMIYLLQVPFSWQGWGLFQYYKYWFILTLCTFPAAFIGWYIKKKNWLSLLILSPMLVLLALICEDASRHLIHEFPHLLITVIFCIAQVLIYLYTFTDKLSQKLIGVLVPVITAAVVLLFPKTVDFTVSEFLPDEAVLTENAVVSVEDTDIAEITISNTGEDSSVLIHAHAYGTTSFTIKDGDDEFKYSIHIYEDDLGSSKVDITAG
ncbi:hypothetical protein [Ruminococcus sp. NK3A76]|uniref:hypothetical protein n=1 Tax=Ruminococcus sp. NK3A76 TaxID=877411 RepID=UPI00048A5683|nr:hypothetical protein [Ruminococcus sp. NK3A76]